MGSLIFALYVNDIQHAMWAECVRLFAGDTVLFVVKTDLKVLISYVKEKSTTLQMVYLHKIDNQYRQNLINKTSIL